MNPFIPIKQSATASKEKEGALKLVCSIHAFGEGGGGGTLLSIVTLARPPDSYPDFVRAVN